MIAEKMITKSETLIKTKKGTLVNKLNHIERMSPEDMVQFLSDSLFKVILLLGIPYFIFVLIQFLMIH